MALKKFTETYSGFSVVPIVPVCLTVYHKHTQSP